MNMINDDFYEALAHNFLMIAGISASLGLAACQPEGSAEKAGQKIDKAVSKVEQTLSQATENGSDKMDSATQSAQDKADMVEKYIDDVMITLKVKSALAGDLILNDSQVEVATANGVVTLSGTVYSERNLGRAIQLADAQEHVGSVISHLLIKTTPRSQ